MPWAVDWLDGHLRILAVRLFDPLQPEDSNTLQQELLAHLNTPAPLFILLDIRECNVLNALAGLSQDAGSLPIPALSEQQRRHSRVAIVGGGAAVSLLLGLIGESSDQLRQFAHEDQALSWLRDCALLTSDSNSTSS